MIEKFDSVRQWQEWNEQGFIPGPKESEEAFQERVAFCLNLEKHLRQSVDTPLPFENQNTPHSQKILEQVLPFTQSLYGMQPRWVPLFFGNYQLSPWHGGCAWIFQLNADTPTAAFLQLRAHFRHSSQFLGIYHRRELIAHELAHVGRMLYEEPQFEEFFAYQSSPSWWRRWFGPIVQSSKETLLFILLMALAVMVDIALISSGSAVASWVWWVQLFPLALLILALGRLIYRHYLLKRCLRKLEAVFSPIEAKHLLYRLCDSEIKSIGKMSQEKIKEFMEQASQESFRWRFLRALYLGCVVNC